MSVTLPNMNLIQPGVSTELGPTWAQQINDSLALVDSHDHTSSKGVKIPTAGLNINGDLPFQSNGATNLSFLMFTQTSAPSQNDALYTDTSGVLRWKTASGDFALITSAGAIAGGFSGDYTTTDADANYSDLTKTFTFKQSASVTADIQSGSISIFENVASSESVKLSVVSSLASSYTLTLPSALPASTGLLSMNTSGELATVENGLQNLTSDEVTQLGNINSNTISNTQWGYVGALDQGLTTTSNVTFATTLHADGTEALPGLAFSGDTNTGVYRTTADVLRISAGGSQIANFSSGGLNPGSNDTYNLGVGGGAWNRIFMASGSESSPSYTFGTDTDTGIYNSATDEISFSNGGTRSWRITASGNIVALDDNRIFGSDGTVSSPSFSFINDSDTGLYLGGTNQLDFTAGGVNTATVTNSAFEVNLSNNSYFFFGTTTTTNDIFSAYSNVGGAFTQKWRVEADGDTISATGSYTSDERAKKDVEDIHYGLNEILQLKPKSFRWLTDDSNEAKSFCISMAQHIETLMPEMVRDDGITMPGQEVPEDVTNGNDTRERYKSVYEKEVVAVMVKAIQEQQEIINNLETRLEALESK